MSASLSQTLNSITVTKLQGISKQLADFNAHRDSILSKLTTVSNPRERVQILLDGISSWRSVDASSNDSNISQLGIKDHLLNVKKFLVQAEHDASIGEATLRGWEADFTTYLDQEKVKNEYAELFGRLLTQWIGSPQKSDEELPFEKVGRKEMHEQRAMFESLVFTAKEIDAVAMTAYLEELFSSKAAKEQLVSIRESTESFGKQLLESRFDVEVLKLTIAALLAGDLLSNEKRETLKEFSQNESVLTEVSDVLDMHLVALTTWTWGTAIPVEMRRQINGKYRIFMDEEILQAIFLHWIGLRWATHFKTNFQSFFQSSAWKLTTKPLSRDENERRGFFLGEEPRNDMNLDEPTTIDEARRAKQFELFFMNQLPSSLEKPAPPYDDDAEKEPGEKTAVEIKQSLLHILTTECLLNKTLYDKFTVVRSDFQWFGPSLPHTSILTALKFFGVSEAWLTFFQKFLAAPLTFAVDGPKATPQVRKRGIPISHSLGDLFGEVLLFCMDYAVNQRADGLFLYRIHDDFWIWDKDSAACVKAWQEMSTFTRLVGLEFNYEKTGSVSVGQPPHPDLPKGTIKWGFLNFEESGQFVIDQSQVDEHIDELKLQLKACEHSVLAWIQAYNKYVSSFFVNNFGSPPAQCFGQRHIDMVISTLKRIHLALFPDHGGSVIEYLADKIESQFGVRDIPPGWFMWPIAMGGLEVKSPFIPQYAIRDLLLEDPPKKFTDELEQERDGYDDLQASWENGTTKKPYTSNPSLLSEPFLSYEEYGRHREQRLERWKAPYEALLAVPEDSEMGESLNTPLELVDELAKITRDGAGICRQWYLMTTYWRWVVACYGGSVIKKWGGLELVRPGSLPIGMVEVWKSRKVRWEQ